MPEDRAFLSCDSRQSPGSANRSLAPSRTQVKTTDLPPDDRIRLKSGAAASRSALLGSCAHNWSTGDRRRGRETLPPGIARRPHIGAHPRPAGAVASSGIPAVSRPRCRPAPATARHRHWLLPHRSRLLEELTLSRAGMVRVHEFVHRLAKTWLLVLHGRGSPSGSGPWTPRRLPGASSGPPRTTGRQNRRRAPVPLERPPAGTERNVRYTAVRPKRADRTGRNARLVRHLSGFRYGRYAFFTTSPRGCSGARDQGMGTVARSSCQRWEGLGNTGRLPP